MSKVPAVVDTEEKLVVTRGELASMMNEGAERVRTAMRGAATREKEAALAAQAAAHVLELERLALEKVEAQKEAHAHGYWKAAVHFGLTAFAAGAVLAALLVFWVLMIATDVTGRAATLGSQIGRTDEHRGTLQDLREGN